MKKFRVPASVLAVLAAGHPSYAHEKPQAAADRPRPASSGGPVRLAASVPAAPRISTAGTFGFHSFGEYAKAVRVAAADGGALDQRLVHNAGASTYSQEGVGADGGFAVPPDFRASIMSRLFDQDSLLVRCDVQQTSGNSYTVPVDEATPWGTGGIRAFWTPEAGPMPQTKPTLGQVTMRLHKLSAMVPITEEMLEDAPAIGSYLATKTPEAMDWEIAMAIAWGSGVGRPLGFMNSPALVTQAAEAGQASGTINAINLSKMLSRVPFSSRRNAIWLIHPDAEPQLPQMSIGNQAVFVPANGYADAPYGRLLGRPMIPHQVAATLGELGDIMLVDLGQYLAVKRASGVIAQSSIHLWFDQDIRAFRFTFRLAGQPWNSEPIAPRSGTTTQSPFVALAVR